MTDVRDNSNSNVNGECIRGLIRCFSVCDDHKKEMFLISATFLSLRYLNNLPRTFSPKTATGDCLSALMRYLSGLSNQVFLVSSVRKLWPDEGRNSILILTVETIRLQTMRRYWFILALLFSFAGVRTLYAQPDPGTEDPTYDPSQELYMGLAAQLLAEDIKHLYGGSAWNDSLLIAFDYVNYTKDGKEIVRYRQEWNRLTDEALLSGTLGDGRSFEVRFSSLRRREGVMRVDSVPIPEAFQQTSLNTAYHQFMYNTRWLLLPIQLVDSGITLERLKDTVVGDKRVATLKASFEKDSTGPSLWFLIYVNPTYKNIERWRVSYNGVEQEYIWRLYQRIDPFLLSMKRYSEDFKNYVQFENLTITLLDKQKIAELAQQKKQQNE